MNESFAEFLKEESFSRITCVRCGFPNLKADKLLLVKKLGRRNLDIAVKIKKRLSAPDFSDGFISVRDMAKSDFRRRKKVAVACLGKEEVKKTLEALK